MAAGKYRSDSARCVEKEKWYVCEAEKGLLTFMQPEARQAWWPGLQIVRLEAVIGFEGLQDAQQSVSADAPNR